MDWSFSDLVERIIERFKAKQFSARDRQLLRYVLELDKLYSDLELIPTELTMAVRNYYAKPEHWPLKKFHTTYHPENFAFRVHAYREKTFRFINLALKLGVPEKMDNPIKQILLRLKGHPLPKLHRLLVEFSEHETIRKWVKRRNTFVHAIPISEVSSLSSAQVVLFDVLRKDGVFEDEWAVLQESEEINAYCERLAETMGATLGYLSSFRRRLANQLPRIT